MSKDHCAAQREETKTLPEYQSLLLGWIRSAAFPLGVFWLLLPQSFLI